jgi:hypothetical protein
MNKKKTGSRIPFYLALAVVAGFGLILFLNGMSQLGVMPAKYIFANDVRGMAVMHNNKLYTLNFEQQNQLVDIFNRSIPVGKELVETRKTSVANVPEIQKIIVYRFNASDLEIIPVAYVSKSSSPLDKTSTTKFSLVFSVPEWDPHGLMEESTSDDLSKLLSSTYGP